MAILPIVSDIKTQNTIELMDTLVFNPCILPK